MFDALADKLAQNIALVQQLQERVANLEAAGAGIPAAIEAMEAAARNFRFRGLWRDGEQYAAGNFVVLDGSTWHCNVASRSRPGEGADWSIAAMRGSRGKPAEGAKP